MSSPSAAPYGAAHPAVPENVARGMLFALGAVLGAIVLTVVLFEAGFLAGLSGLVVAAGSVALYVKGAGTAPRRGLKSLIALILVGGVVSILAAVVVDVWRQYDKAVATYGQSAVLCAATPSPKSSRTTCSATMARTSGSMRCSSPWGPSAPCAAWSPCAISARSGTVRSLPGSPPPRVPESEA